MDRDRTADVMCRDSAGNSSASPEEKCSLDRSIQIQSVTEILVTDDPDLEDVSDGEPLNPFAGDLDLLMVDENSCDELQTILSNRSPNSSGAATPTTSDPSLLFVPHRYGSVNSCGSSTPEAESMASLDNDQHSASLGNAHSSEGLDAIPASHAMPKMTSPISDNSLTTPTKSDLIRALTLTPPPFGVDHALSRPNRPTSIECGYKRAYYDFSPTGETVNPLRRRSVDARARKRHFTDPALKRTVSSDSSAATTRSTRSCHTSLEDLTDYYPSSSDDTEYMRRRSVGPSVIVACSPDALVHTSQGDDKSDDDKTTPLSSDEADEGESSRTKEQ